MTQAAQHTKKVFNKSRSTDTLDLTSKLYDTQTWISESMYIRKTENNSLPDSFFLNVLKMKYVVTRIPQFVDKAKTIKVFE